MLLLLPSYLLACTALILGVVLLFVLRLEPDSDEDELLKALKSVANEPFNLKHHAAYIRLALQMRSGEDMAADAWAQMVNAVPATDHKLYVYQARIRGHLNNLTHI